jgi:hypothetical protein
MSRQHNKTSSIRQFNPDAAILDLRREPWLYNVPIQSMLAASHVELPAMPGASHHATGQVPFAQRPTLMRANAVEREELSVHVEQGDDTVPDDRFQRVARQASVNGGDLVPGHEQIN